MAPGDVEIVRALQPPEGTDLVSLFTEEAAWRAFEAQFSDRFEPDFECAAMGSPAGDLEARGFEGLLGLWGDWLEPWNSYRTAIDDVSAVGDAVADNELTFIGVKVEHGLVPGIASPTMDDMENKYRFMRHVERLESRKIFGSGYPDL